jgi:hypothetical protein
MRLISVVSIQENASIKWQSDLLYWLKKWVEENLHFVPKKKSQLKGKAY